MEACTVTLFTKLTFLRSLLFNITVGMKRFCFRIRSSEILSHNHLKKTRQNIAKEGIRP